MDEVGLTLRQASHTQLRQTLHKVEFPKDGKVILSSKGKR